MLKHLISSALLIALVEPAIAQPAPDAATLAIRKEVRRQVKVICGPRILKAYDWEATTRWDACLASLSTASQDYRVIEELTRLKRRPAANRR